MDLRYVFAGLLWFAMLCGPMAKAQNEPVNGLQPRGPPQASDLIPILPVGAPRLLYTTVGALGVGGGSGSVTEVTCGTGLNGGTFTTIGTCSLANPSASVLGGIESIVAASHKWINAISTLGVPSQTQPACTDLSDATYCNVSLTNGIALGNIAQSGANTMLGNWSGSTANVAAQAMPSCADTGGNHLNYVSGTGLTCGNSANSGSGVAPNLLKFGPPTVIQYYDPQPANLIVVTDNFASTGTFTKVAGSGTATLAVSGNVGTVTLSGAADAQWQETSDATLLAPEFFNSIEVTAITPGISYANIYTGAFKNTSNYAAIYYDARNLQLTAEYRHGGTNVNVPLKTSFTLTAPYWVGASLIGNSLCGWYKSTAAAPWTFGGCATTTANFDYTTTTNFASAGYKTGFYVAMGGAGAVSLASLQGGRFGGIAMRDLKPVTNPDWTTYQPGSNTIYFVGTVQGPSGVQLGASASAVIGVFSLNLSTLALTETGVICPSRGGHIYCADAAPNLIYHSNGDRELITSGWGTYGGSGVLVWYADLANGSQGDLLSTNLSVVAMAQVTLPLGGGTVAYDPALAYDAANSRCLMAYTIGASPDLNFFPALASMPASGGGCSTAVSGTWTLIGSDSTVMVGFEGTSFANVGGTFYELAGGPGNPPASPAWSGWPWCSQSRVYTASFVYTGQIQGATFDPNTTGGFNCSHPTMFQHPDGQHMVMLSFNATQFNATAGATGQPMIEISTP